MKVSRRTIEKNGGIYDTRTYRYVIRDDGIYRIKIAYLDTTKALNGWEKIENWRSK